MRKQNESIFNCIVMSKQFRTAKDQQMKCDRVRTRSRIASKAVTPLRHWNIEIHCHCFHHRRNFVFIPLFFVQSRGKETTDEELCGIDRRKSHLNSNQKNYSRIREQTTHEKREKQIHDNKRSEAERRRRARFEEYAIIDTKRIWYWRDNNKRFNLFLCHTHGRTHTTHTENVEKFHEWEKTCRRRHL